MVMYQMPAQPGICQHYQDKQARGLGITQVIVGILCILFQIVAICVSAGVAPAGSGIWCGIFFILAGAFGIVSAQQKTTCWIVSCMVFSILSAILTMPLIGLSGGGISMDNDYYRRSQYNNYNNGYDPYGYNNGGYYSGYYNYNVTSSQHSTHVAINVILILLALVEVVASIWASAVCCHGACCGRRSATPGVVYYNGASVPSGQVVQPVGGQQMVMVNSGQPNMVYAMPQNQNTYVVQQGGALVTVPSQQPGFQQAYPPQQPGVQQAYPAMQMMQQPPPYNTAMAPIHGYPAGGQTQVATGPSTPHGNQVAPEVDQRKS